VCAAAAVVELGAAAQGRVPRAAARGGSPAPALSAAWLSRLARLGRRVGSWGPSRDLDARLAAAGLAPRLRAADVMAAKVGAALVTPAVAAPFAAVLPGRVALTSLIAAACGGFLAPDLWLRRRAAARARAMGRELPDVVDLIRVAVAGGLPVSRALTEVGRRRRGLLAGELRAVAARVELGMPLAQALALLSARCPIGGVEALAAAVQRADRHGAPLAPALAAIAGRARAERARRLREQAARAAPKMQLVVALLLAPAVMLAVGAALAATVLG
jgi:tight adherence protein C